MEYKRLPGTDIRQPVKKFPSFIANLLVMYVFTEARQWSLSSAKRTLIHAKQVA
jgi:hypothetical protein